MEQDAPSPEVAVFRQLIWRRLAALLLDGAAGVTLTLAVAVLIARAGIRGTLAIDLGVLAVVAVAVMLGLDVILHARRGTHAGQSLGKQVLGLRVVTTDGEDLTALRLLGRQVLRVPVLLLGSYAMLESLIHPGGFGRLALHDRLLRTAVVRSRTGITRH